MMVFDHVVPEVARRDQQVLRRRDGAGRVATYVFREYYCDASGCDCRRVVIVVEWVEAREIAATIKYAFARPRGGSQIELDPQLPQGELAEELVAEFAAMVEEERYRRQLHRHYAMFKRVVDDPTQRDRDRDRKQVVETRRKAPRAPVLAGLERVAPAVRGEGRLQKRFRSLLRKVDVLREGVQAWRERRPDIERRFAEMAALGERHARQSREMVEVLDRVHESGRLGKLERKKLAAVIADIAAELIERGGHDDLKPLYNRYSASDFDAEVAEADAENAARAKAMMEMYGFDFDGAAVETLEEVRAHVLGQIDAEEAAAAAKRTNRRKQSARQVAAEAQRAEQQQAAHKAVQEIYRALALALHPDREQDPVERARKTKLMSEANLAYEAKDLLRLLELQLELERVESAKIDLMAEERLTHYNRILDEQAKRLATELEDLERPFRLEMDLAPRVRFGPVDVIASLDDEIASLEEHIEELARDRERFQDIAYLKRWLKGVGGPPPPQRDMFR